MSFYISNQNIQLLEYLNNINKEEHNNFLNYILQLGFDQYNKIQSLNKIKSNNFKVNNYNSNLESSLDDKLDNKLNDKFNNIYSLINEIKLENQNNLLILNKNNNKGNIGENIIYEFFNNNNYQIEDTSEIAHSGDLKLYLSEINQNVLIEIKNYKNTVDQKQIDKFYYDLDYTGIKLGIFISLNSKIVNLKYPIEWKITNNNLILIFISECTTHHLYLAIFCLISLYKNNKLIQNYDFTKNEELFNDIKYLDLQKESINKLKNEILNIHSNYSNSILTLYNNLCIFDNNFNYILNKIYNKLDSMINKIGCKDNDIHLKLENIATNNKDLLEMIISDLNNNYKLELIDNKKIKIFKNSIFIGEIKILKTTINLILESGLELKNINKDNWNKIINLL
jgi:hypothetical protein